MEILTEKRYKELSAFWESHPVAGQTVIWVNRILTGAVYLLYPVMMLWLLKQKDIRLLRCVLVPGVSFILVSILRKGIGAKRPYEMYGGKPLISKETEGNSFPSRHVFSIFVIGMTGLYLNTALGCALLIAGVILAAMRVLGGVHFTKDVAAGAVLGILAGMLLYIG